MSIGSITLIELQRVNWDNKWTFLILHFEVHTVNTFYKACKQSDQIGRIFAQWVIVCLG
jgi:hypothetical protein